jgi:hypothetical protein
MAGDQRQTPRICFNHQPAAWMMAIDGTWRRSCTIEDVSESGARLRVTGSLPGLHLKQFFLLLSSTGLAYRRCELVWVNGGRIGVWFPKSGKSPSERRASAAR